MSVGVDVGGTFTDVVAWDRSRLEVAKTPTTTDQSDGVRSGVGEVTKHVPLVIHGTTVATNALLERAGARVALITDAGFEDVIEIGRQDRPALYDPFADRPEPLVPRDRRLGITGDEIDVRGGPEVDVFAVGLLHGYADPERDLRVAGRLAARGIGEDDVVLAGVDLGEFREFERISTAVLTAYLRPIVRRYLTNLTHKLVPEVAERLLVMRSSGGLMTPSEAVRRAAAILLSGPAGGVVATARLGDALGMGSMISFDMGGTSTDVCRIEDGRPEIAYEREVDGYICRIPSVAVHTVGAGGGSIGWLDPGGALRVGPRSAGAEPGPACYGRGGDDPTVTDANLVLGRIDPAGTLAGSIRLRLDLAEAAVGRLGAPSELDAVETATGMIRVVEANMERAIRKVSVEEGADPRQAVLVAFGGAGGLHATALAQRLQMAGVVVPPHAGVFSALGLLVSPPRRDVVRSVLAAPDSTELDRALNQVASEASEGLEADTGSGPSEIETVVDVRYRGQSHETAVRYQPGDGWRVLEERFHRAHRERNGFARPGDPIEAVTVRAAAIGVPVARWSELPEHRPSGAARRGSRTVMIDGRSVEASVWWRPGMTPGDEVRGPGVIEEPESTTLLGTGDRATLHPSGALVIEW